MQGCCKLLERARAASHALAPRPVTGKSKRQRQRRWLKALCRSGWVPTLIPVLPSHNRKPPPASLSTASAAARTPRRRRLKPDYLTELEMDALVVGAW